MLHFGYKAYDLILGLVAFCISIFKVHFLGDSWIMAYLHISIDEVGENHARTREFK